MHVTNVRQALLNDFNKANNINPPVTLNDVQWDNIEIFAQGACNSRVTIRAIPTSLNFTGQQTVNYNRHMINEDLRGVKIPGKRSDYVTIRDVVRALRDQLGIPMEPDEFIDEALTDPDSVLLRPTVRSMAYFPSSSVELGFQN